MKRIFLLSTALIFSAGMAFASINASDLVAAYQAQGYSKIEVTTGLTQFKVEAIQGTAKVVVIYDAATGAILSQHTRHASAHDTGEGVVLTDGTHDFLGTPHSEHENEVETGDDHHNGSGGSDDNGSDSNDDHGSDGGHDDGGHDNGGHDKGSDHKSEKSDKHDD